MIFSMLNMRKKTSATLAGIAVAGLCLWGLASWQDIDSADLLIMLAAILVMIMAIMVGAALLVILFRLLRRGLALLQRSSEDSQSPD